MAALTNIPIPLSSIPTSSPQDFTQSYISSAISLLQSFDSSSASGSSTWKKGKTFSLHGVKVDTYSRKKAEENNKDIVGGEDSWTARKSVHSNAGTTGYDSLKKGLFYNHSVHEREYIADCLTSTLIATIIPPPQPDSLSRSEFGAEVWTLTYHTPSPTSNRAFTVLFINIETQAGAEFLNISIPVDTPTPVEEERGCVKGKYVSVERVRVLEGGKNVEWFMATSSSAGGSIPNFVTNLALPSKIAEDVPSFFNWVAKWPQPVPITPVPASTGIATPPVPKESIVEEGMTLP